MWQKLVAGACVMTGALGFGWSLCGEMSLDIRHLRAQKQIILYIIGEITYLHRPMGEIFDIVSGKTEPPYDSFLSELARKMKERDGKSLIHIWNETLLEGGFNKEVSRTGLDYLEKMGRCFECGSERLQTEALGLFAAELDGEIDRLTAIRDENSRLIKALSTLAGILCVILFM